MSNEQQLLFAIYHLYKSEQINESQRGELKDLLIKRDKHIMELREPYEQSLLVFLDNQSDATSLCSQKSYKHLRPEKLNIKPAYRKSLQDISEVININQQNLTSLFKKKKL